VYSIPSVYNYYVGSVPPNGQASIVLINTTAYVSVCAANIASKLGGFNPDAYVFSFSGDTTGSATIAYNSISTTYTAVFSGLTALSDYTFSGYTITNTISYGGEWSYLTPCNAGGPRAPVAPYVSYSVLGNPLTQSVSLQVVIFTGCAGVTGLWADTSYYINVSSAITPVPGPYTFSTMTLSSYVVSVQTGNTYYANIYAVKNQVTGPLFPETGFVVPPAPPLNPTITLAPTPDLNVIDSRGVSKQVLYVTYPKGLQPFPPYRTTKAGNYTVTVAGGGGGDGGGTAAGAGGLVTYTFSNIPEDSLIYYIVGGGGTEGLYRGAGGGGAGSAVSINDLLVFAGGGGGGGGGLIGGDGQGGGGGNPWGSSTDPNLLTNLGGGNGNAYTGGHGGGNPYPQVGGGLGGNGVAAATSGSGDGPAGRVVTPGGGSPAGQPGYVRIGYSPAPTPISATISWGQSATSDVSYYYSVNDREYANNNKSTVAQISLPYGSTSKISVYSIINGVSSTAIQSPSAYVFANPPTALTYSRSFTSITLSWGSAYQPQYPSNITYTLSVTSGSTVSGLSIGGSVGPKITIGSTIMTPAVYSQFVTALNIANQRPIVITLSGLGGVTYNASFTVTSIGGIIIQSAIGAYSFGGNGSSLTSPSEGTSIAFSITNPPALPTDGYIVRDLLSGTIFGSNIYSNSYVITGTLGVSYNLMVQALNSNLYSSPLTSPSTGIFKLSTTAISTLSATYSGGNVTLTWKNPQEYVETTLSAYSWTIFNQSGTKVVSSTVSGYSSSTQQVTNLVPGLGGTYTYSITANYYGISSDTTVANQISLRTTPTTSVTQTVSGFSIRVSWATASQSVYLPETPNILSVIVPNGGYDIRDIGGKYSTTVNVSGTITEKYITIPTASYDYYNFSVTAVHNGISSSTTVPGPIYLGVSPVTNPTVSLNGMLATLTWTRASTNGTTVPYQIYDSNGYPIGDPYAPSFQTITCNIPGVYSFTSLRTEIIVATAYGAGGVAAGGVVSNVYSVLPGTTIVAKVGAYGSGSAGDSTTVYVPNAVNPQLILDAGGGGGYTVSGQGFFRNGGLPYPDGGPPLQPGYGSGGNAELGKGSPAGADGKVEISMTTQPLTNSIQTTNTSISFLVQNNKTYNFQIVSYNTTLSATASVTLTTSVVSPTNLITSYTGLQLRNEWTVLSGATSYLVTNMITGTYNIVVPATLRSAVFSELGVAEQSYRFAILALSNDIPSSSQIYSSPVSIVSKAPTNFVGTNNGTIINLSATGDVLTPSEKFTLTDGSGNILIANMEQATTNANVTIPPLTGIPGVIYNYNLYGITNGLSSRPVPLTLGLTIPGSTNLGLNPDLSTGTTQTNLLTVYQCVPPADEFRAVSTNLASSFYNNLPIANWIGVAMSTDGRISVAVSDASNGSNIYVSTNKGVGWGGVFTAGMLGLTARNVTIAGNGTWSAVATSAGLWVSSNISTFSPWFYVSNTAGSNIISSGFSPNGSTLVVGQSNGFIYYISNSQLYPGNPSPVFTSGQNVERKNWISTTWSGEGNMVFAAPTEGKAVYSITGGEFWTQFTPPGAFTSISPNSNGTYVLLGQKIYPKAYQRDKTNYNFEPVFPGQPNGLPSLSTESYRCACSYQGNIQTALVVGVSSPSAYISYDFGYNWVSDTRFTPPFTGSAISSNGFIQIVVGMSGKIQSVINVPVSTGDEPISIPIGLTTISAAGYVGQGVTGYEVIPYRKNISGQSVFVWTVQQNGPSVLPQTTGPASFTTAPYASGYSNNISGYIVGYFVFDNTTNPKPGQITTEQISTAGGSSPTLNLEIQTNTDVIVYSLIQTGGNIYPGTYTYKFAVTSGNATTVSITLPLKPPSGLTLAGQYDRIYGSWTPPVGLIPSYNIYSNGTLITTVTTSYTTIPNIASGVTEFGVKAVLNGILSTIITANAYAPPAPVIDNQQTYILTSNTFRLSWISNTNTTYKVESSQTLGGAKTLLRNYDASGLIDTTLPVGSTYYFTITPLSNNLQGIPLVKQFTSAVVVKEAGGGASVTFSFPAKSSIVSLRMYGGGGGGGSGLYSTGGGGGAGGYATGVAGGSPSTYNAGDTVNLIAGAGGNGAASGYPGGGGGGGGGVSFATINTSLLTWAGGGGGGGGFVFTGVGYTTGRGGGGGGGYGGQGGGGNGGGGQPASAGGGGGGFYSGGGGGYGGQGGGAGGDPGYGKPGGGGGNSYQQTGGGYGGGAQAGGNNASGFGCGGGGGGGFVSSTGTSTAGGAGSGGYVFFQYVYLT